MKKSLCAIFIWFCILMGLSVKAKTLVTNFSDYSFGGEKIVLDEKQLLYGYEYMNYHQEVSASESKNVQNIKFIHNDEYVVYGSFNIMEKEFPYIAYYKNMQLVFEKTYLELNEGKFIDLLIDGDKFVAVGNLYDNICDSKILIAEVGNNGNLLQKNVFEGTRGSYAYNIYCYDKFYYVVGLTYACDFEGYNSDNLSSIIVFNVLKNNLHILDLLMLSNSDGAKFYDCVNLDENFYILAEVNGKGDFQNGNKQYFNVLIQCDYQLGQPNYICINEEIENTKLFNYQKNILLVQKEDTNTLSFVEYSKSLDKVKDFEYLNYENEIDDFFISTEEAQINILFTSGKKANLVVLEDYQLLYKRQFNDIANNILGFFRKDNILYFHLDNDNSLVLTSFHVKVDKNMIYINGKMIETQSSEESNNNQFGDKTIYHQGEFDNIIIYYSQKESIPLQVNIVNFGVYDIGLKLIFNAKGYLNGEEIVSGYTINSCDKYLLELESSNGERVSFYFTVSNLTTEKKEEAQFDNYYLNTDVLINENPKNLETKSDANIALVEESYDLFYIPLLFGIGVIVGLLIMRRRKHA